MSKRGKFITFEGLDCSGKTTLLEMLRRRLNEHCGPGSKRRIFTTREPSDNLPGLICRGIAKGLITLGQEAEALLYAADRCEHIEAELLPQLKQGNHVLCDRYYFSNFAYQGSRTSITNLVAYNRRAMELLRADATVFIDVPPEECEKRRARERATAEIYENLERARLTYDQYRKAFSLLRAEENVLMIDGLGKPEAVFERVWGALYGSVFLEGDFV